jgi:hypothetical protein
MAKLAGVKLAANCGVDRGRLASHVAGQFIGPLLAKQFRATDASVFAEVFFQAAAADHVAMPIGLSNAKPYSEGRLPTFVPCALSTGKVLVRMPQPSQGGLSRRPADAQRRHGPEVASKLIA